MPRPAPASGAGVVPGEEAAQWPKARRRSSKERGGASPRPSPQPQQQQQSLLPALSSVTGASPQGSPVKGAQRRKRRLPGQGEAGVDVNMSPQHYQKQQMLEEKRRQVDVMRTSDFLNILRTSTMSKYGLTIDEKGGVTLSRKAASAPSEADELTRTQISPRPGTEGRERDGEDDDDEMAQRRRLRQRLGDTDGVRLLQRQQQKRLGSFDELPILSDAEVSSSPSNRLKSRRASRAGVRVLREFSHSLLRGPSPGMSMRRHKRPLQELKPLERPVAEAKAAEGFSWGEARPGPEELSDLRCVVRWMEDWRRVDGGRGCKGIVTGAPTSMGALSPAGVGGKGWVTPRHAYVEGCDELCVRPEAMVVRLVHAAARNGAARLNGYLMGDEQAIALAKSLPYVDIRSLYLADNRLTNRSLTALLQNVRPRHLTKLDLSRNTRLGEAGFDCLSRFVQSSESLEFLSLECTGLNDRSFARLAAALCPAEIDESTGLVMRQCPLKHLNVSRNFITDTSMDALATLLRQTQTLVSLDVSWNQIGADGCVSLCDGLKANASLEEVDLSWSSLGAVGKGGEGAAGRAIGEALAKNGKLTHLDLGYNGLGAVDCEALAEPLKANKRLMGLHMGGNAGGLDGCGYITPTRPCQDSSPAGHVLTRILSSVFARVRGHDAWLSRSRCWICEKWGEKKFVFDPKDYVWGSPGIGGGAEIGDSGVSGAGAAVMDGDGGGRDVVGEAQGGVKGGEDAWSPPPIEHVFVCASFDDWTMEVMEKTADGTYELHRMVPPHCDSYYYFLVDGQPAKLRPKTPSSATSVQSVCGAHTDVCVSSQDPLSDTSRSAVSLDATESISSSTSMPQAIAIDVADDRLSMNMCPSTHSSRSKGTTESVCVVQARDTAMLTLALRREFRAESSVPNDVHILHAATHRRKRQHSRWTRQQQQQQQQPSSQQPMGGEAQRCPTYMQPRYCLPRARGEPHREITPVAVSLWRFEDSIFASYRADSDAVLRMAFKNDLAQTRLEAKLSKFPGDTEQALAKLQEHWPLIKDVYKHYTAAYSSEVFTMGQNSFSEFLSRCEILDPEGKGCDRTESETQFIAINLTGPKHPFNNRRALTRAQFMDIIASHAIAKFVKTGMCAVPSEAIEKLVQEHIGPNAERDDGGEFRTEVLWKEEPDTIFRNYEEILRKVYNANAGAENLPGEPKDISVGEWMVLVENAGLMDEYLVDRSVRLAYVRAIQTSVDELNDKRMHRRMQWVEFIEAIGRLAYMRWKAEATSMGGSTDPKYFPYQELRAVVQHIVRVIAPNHAMKDAVQEGMATGEDGGGNRKRRGVLDGKARRSAYRSRGDGGSVGEGNTVCGGGSSERLPVDGGAAGGDDVMSYGSEGSQKSLMSV